MDHCCLVPADTLAALGSPVWDVLLQLEFDLLAPSCRQKRGHQQYCAEDRIQEWMLKHLQNLLNRQAAVRKRSIVICIVQLQYIQRRQYGSGSLERRGVVAAGVPWPGQACLSGNKCPVAALLRLSSYGSHLLYMKMTRTEPFCRRRCKGAPLLQLLQPLGKGHHWTGNCSLHTPPLMAGRIAAERYR
jgi:hypothetical protein